MHANHHLRYLAHAAWAHTRPKRPWLPRADWIRLGGGMIVAAIVGASLAVTSPAAAVLINVGSFFGALISLLPRHHSRISAIVAGLVLVDGGAAIGVLLSDWPVVELVLLFVGLFIAGAARAVSVGAFMRLLFAAIAVCTTGEMAQAASAPKDAWLAMGAFIVGQVIVAGCACISRPGQSFSDQRTAVAELYRQMARLADGDDADFSAPRMQARVSVELIPLLQLNSARWIRTITDLSDGIAATVSTTPRPDDAHALRWISQCLTEQERQPLPDDLDVSEDVALAVDAVRSERFEHGSHRLRPFTPSDTTRLILRELRDPRGITFRFALRVAITGIVCQSVGEFLIENVGGGVPLHGFWTLLAGCLVAMPDFHDTTGRAIARTLGSVIGAILGSGLALVPGLQSGPGWSIVATLLVIGYLVARSVSQAVLMIVVVGWLAFILGGEAAGFTRAFDTLVGAVIAGIVFLILPTWNVHRLPSLFRQWCSMSRTALTVAVGAATSTSELAEDEERAVFRDLYHVLRRFEHASAAVPNEPNMDKCPWPVESLTPITRCMDRIALNLMQLRQAAHHVTVSPDRMEQFAEGFGELGTGQPVVIPEVDADPAPLAALRANLDELNGYTQRPTAEVATDR